MDKDELRDKDIYIDVEQFLETPSICESKKIHACILFADLVGSTEFKSCHGTIEGLAKTV